MHLINRLTVFIALLSFQTSLINAQSLSSFVTSNGGGFWQTANQSLQYTIGEESISTYTTGDQTLTEGFEQSQLVVTAVSTIDNSSEINVYPNPASTEVIIDVAKSNDGYQKVYFTDMLGRQIAVPVTLNSSVITCDVSSLSSGTYLLNLVMKNSNIILNYKIIKIPSF
jgi:hypothetical protein